MSEHTKEPWRGATISPAYDWEALVGADGTPIFRYTIDDDGLHFKADDVRRIVACVNWCEGNSTEGMDLAVSIGRPYTAERDSAIEREIELTNQRDELLAACKAALNHCDRETTHMLEAAIAKAEGGAA